MGQRGGQQGQRGLVGVPVSSTLAWDTTAIHWHWSQGRGRRCHPDAAAGDQPTYTLHIPACARHVQPRAHACAGVPGSATLSHPGVGASSRANRCCPIRGNVLAASHHGRPWPCHAITTGCAGQSCCPNTRSGVQPVPCHSPIPASLPPAPAPPPCCPAGTMVTLGSP